MTFLNRWTTLTSLLLLLGPVITSITGAASVQQDEEPPQRVAAKTEDAERAHLGEVFSDLTFESVDGRKLSWSRYAEKKPLLIVLRDSTCPICKKFGPALARFEKEMKDDLRVVFLNPMAHDSAADAKAEIERFGFRGLYVRDARLELARALKATSSAEVFLFDADRRLRYRGAFDDRYGIGFAHDEPKRNFASDAVLALKRGEEPQPAATTAPGCMLDLGEIDGEEPTVTFHGRISRIMQKYCQRCHIDGENAPFSLESYDDVSSRKGMIRYVLKKNLMPPWYASDEHGGPWLDDLRMPEADKEAILSWIEKGCPEGDPAGAPEPLPRVDGWKIGKPDAVFEVPSKLRVPAEGDIPYRYVVIETDFPEDRWIEKIELRSDRPDVVHHILVFYHLDEHLDSNPQFLGHLALEGFFAIHSPGVEPIEYPSDRAKLLKKRQRLLFQIHYNAIGEEVWDRPRIGFKFRDGPPKFPILCNAASTKYIRIPPGAEHHAVAAEYSFPRKARIFGYVPHMHARGSAFAMDLLHVDGREERVLWVPKFDFNWQQSYRLKNPIDVPAGTRIRATGWFDNSARNPANPDPTAEVFFGLQTYDEMMIGYFEWMPLD